MHETLDHYIRIRAKELGLNLSEVCRRAGLSRQTLYALAAVPDKLPALQTIVSLADVLQVHPLRLLNLVFDTQPTVRKVPRQRVRSDHSAFIRDVTFPDGALVLPGQRFTKTWELQNVGRVPWEGRFLQCMDEEIVVYARSGETLTLAHNLVPATTRIPVPPTPPGATVQLSVNFHAPEPAGTVLSYWKSVFADGTVCFPESQGLWVKVRVSTLTSGAYGERGPLVADTAFAI